MNNQKESKIKVLFSESHRELLTITEAEDSEYHISSMRQLLKSLDYDVASTTQVISPDQLAVHKILVIGAPREDLEIEEVGVIKEFVEQGGGLLIISNSKTFINPKHRLNELAGIAGLEIREYLNYPPTVLQKFRPHYITANLKWVKVGNVASIIPGNGAYPLAFTDETKQPIIGCANAGLGRVVAIGDVDLFTNELLADKNNEKLVANTFCWLAVRNVIEVEEITIPGTVTLGQSVVVLLKLKNNDSELRPQVKCVLESDADALISEPAKKKRSIPPNATTLMQWTVTPQTLGEQKLRIALHVQEQTSLYFDQLSEMRCLAPGYLTLEIKDKTGASRTSFERGESFTAEGIFHWTAESNELPYQLKLNFTEGFIEREYQTGFSRSQWLLRATTIGTHKLELVLAETGQSLSALIQVSRSASDRITELKVAYVFPLNAEIAARLKQVDERLACDQVIKQPFEILSPKEFVEQVYEGYSAAWLKEVINSANRERGNNPDLLDLVLTYISPVYLTNRGAFIPCDPHLASHLAELHPDDKRYLEYNLLCSEESENINIKQNIAAYLLHEKYGHGFFYTQTRLGQQLATLQKYGYLSETGNDNDKKAAKLINDSAIIVNEGFAAWMEMIFLKKLDHEVRQAFTSRQIFLLDEATGFYQRQLRSEFFETFPPRYNSKYREGFEYLDVISREFSLRCAIRSFLVATNIDFCIVENLKNQPPVEFNADDIRNRLLNPSIIDWRSHHRLRKIAELLYENDEEVKPLFKKQNCPFDCQLQKCPLEDFIYNKLKWRTYESETTKIMGRTRTY
ncbi:MAG: hypothetical protein JXC36_03920 [Candidatus Atribacteria bacterium]|nr:hypothetical protein [Candidatus Atribacteria bacterium]